MANIWVVPTPNDESTDSGTLTIRVGATQTLVFDFGNLDELDGADIASATIALTGGGASVGAVDFSNGYQVKAPFTGATAFIVTVRCTIGYFVVVNGVVVAGETLVATGTLNVVA